jgi:hypothetical protein
LPACGGGAQLSANVRETTTPNSKRIALKLSKNALLWNAAVR